MLVLVDRICFLLCSLLNFHRHLKCTYIVKWNKASIRLDYISLLNTRDWSHTKLVYMDMHILLIIYYLQNVLVDLWFLFDIFILFRWLDASVQSRVYVGRVFYTDDLYDLIYPSGRYPASNWLSNCGKLVHLFIKNSRDYDLSSAIWIGWVFVASIPVVAGWSSRFCFWSTGTFCNLHVPWGLRTWLLSGLTHFLFPPQMHDVSCGIILSRLLFLFILSN